MFEKSTIYIVGNAKTQQNNPITLQYGQFFIGFVIDKETGLIVACDVSSIIHTTTEFISSLFIGKSITEDAEEIRLELETRYFASSQKAILVAFKDAQKKFCSIKQGQKIDLL